MHPQNWPKRLKWTTTILVSAFSFDTMMTSTMVAPALAEITEDLKVPNQAIMQLVLSSYVLAYAFGPFLFAPLSEIYGRVRVLQIASTWFLGWNITSGFARSSGLLVAGRVLSGIGGSAALSVRYSSKFREAC
jgi:MFS family permease